MFENEFRDVSYVNRWNILRRIRNQSVAEHGYYVAIYAPQVARLVEWEGDYATLIEAALIHDLFEGRSGDFPSPFKQQVVNRDKYNDMEYDYFRQNFPHLLGTLTQLHLNKTIKAIIRVADRMEGCIWLAGELAMGNSYVGTISTAGSPAMDMWLSLQDAWHELGNYFDSKDVLGQAWIEIRDAVLVKATRPPKILMASV